MRTWRNPVKTTVIGGLAFLVPMVILVLLGIKGWELMKKLSSPLVRHFDVDHFYGVAIADIVTIAVTIVVCYVAGVVARSGIGRRFYEYVDEKLLAVVPQYAFVRSMTPDAKEADLAAELTPVLVRFDDASQIAFLSELPEDGLATVFIPGAPNPWSGAVMHVERERLQPIDAKFSEVVRRLRMVGQKSSTLLPENSSAPD